METWDDQNFSSEWKKAFDGAEVAPSDKVWGNIDAQLMARENANMKKRVIFYQRLAAASVGVLFLVSGYAFLGNNESQNSIAENSLEKTGIVESTNEIATTKSESELESNLSTPNKQTNSIKSSVEEALGGQSTAKTQPVNNPQGNADVLTHQSIITVVSNDTADPTQLSASTIATESNVTTEIDYLHLVLGPQRLDPPMPKRASPNDLGIAYRIADARPAVMRKKKSNVTDQNTWASLGFAAGNFTNAASNLDLAFADANSTQAFKSPANTSNTGKTEKTKPGSTFTMSLAGGKRLSKHWVLQGGLNYLNQNCNSNTSTVEVAAANEFAGTTASYGPVNTNSVTYTTESEIQSTFQFISVPVQAGYLLLDRKFGVQVNGGISPDVFLRSEVNDSATRTESITTTGSSSSFKAVSISGIGGLEFSYGFSKHYRISLTPGVRYALTPVYKENVLASAKPLMADIGLKFRYVFN